MLITVTEVKNQLGISLADVSEDTFLAQIVKAVDYEAKKYFDRQIEQATYTNEFYCGTNTKVLNLNEYPILSPTAVTDVRIDSMGFWGQYSGGFSTETALVRGSDYSLVCDGYNGISDTGRLFKINGVWPARFESRRGQLAAAVKPGAGNIRVSYTAGYTVIPYDLRLALWQVCVEIRAKRKYGLMPASEGLGEYHYALMAREEIIRLGTADQGFARYRRLRERHKILS